MYQYKTSKQMGKGILYLQKLAHPDNNFLVENNSVFSGSTPTPQHETPGDQKPFALQAKTKSVMINTPGAFLNNPQRKNKEEIYECVNVMIYYSLDQHQDASKKFKFKLIKNAKLGVNAWIQINGGPLDGLDSAFGVSLLEGLNKKTGSNATHIINPFNQCPFDPIKVKRWLITDISVEEDW